MKKAEDKTLWTQKNRAVSEKICTDICDYGWEWGNNWTLYGGLLETLIEVQIRGVIEDALRAKIMEHIWCSLVLEWRIMFLWPSLQGWSLIASKKFMLPKHFLPKLVTIIAKKKKTLWDIDKWVAPLHVKKRGWLFVGLILWINFCTSLSLINNKY